MVTLRKWRQCVLVCIVGAVFSCGYTGAAIEVPSSPPENAAFLYYQVLAYVAGRGVEYPEDIPGSLDDEPSLSVRQFVQDEAIQRMVGLILLATRADTCDWRFIASEGPLMRLWMSVPLRRHLCRLVADDAWVLAADGQYIPALEAALALRRLARHIGDDDFSMWLTAVGVDETAFSTIGAILGRMPANEETLAWLEDELAASTGALWRPRTSLHKWGELGRQYPVDPYYFSEWKASNLALAKDDDLKTELEALTEAEVLKRAYAVYTPYVDSVVGILESEALYQTTFSKLVELDDAYDKWRPILIDLSQTWLGVDMARDFYGKRIRLVARTHATRTAVQIYRVKAKTGQLPKGLPKISWMDPYSGKDFKYETADDGFTLRCGPASCPVSGAPPREFRFKVAEKGK